MPGRAAQPARPNERTEAPAIGTFSAVFAFFIRIVSIRSVDPPINTPSGSGRRGFLRLFAATETVGRPSSGAISSHFAPFCGVLASASP